MTKKLGVLCHVTSLVSDYGIGSFGKPCKDFLDFLYRNKLNIWQVLPLSEINDKNSPYGSLCYFAYEPILVDINDLLKKDLVNEEDVIGMRNLSKTTKVNYKRVRNEITKLWNKAFKNITDELKDNVIRYLSKNKTMRKYAYYKALLEKFGVGDWRLVKECYYSLNTKEAKQFYEENFDLILKHAFIQYLLEQEWQDVLIYAKKRHITILGDLPIYPEINSFDVFDDPKMFLLDDKLSPKVYGGVPPEEFSSTGQNWHTCVYDWDYLKEHAYKPLIDKIVLASSRYNILRLDHFAGYVEHYEIDAKDDTKGQWVKKGGLDFFGALKDQCGLDFLVVENLGVYSYDIDNVMRTFNLKGMKILQFASQNSKDHAPSKMNPMILYYLGTHDNMPFMGFLNSLDRQRKDEFKALLGINAIFDKQIMVECVRQMLHSEADCVILQAQDFLMQGEKARMNLPSDIDGCWEYKMPKNYQTKFAENVIKFTK